MARELVGLSALAREAGLAERWTDAHGAAKRVSPDTLRAVLSAIGYPADSEAQIRDSRARVKEDNGSAAGLTVVAPGAKLGDDRAPKEPGYYDMGGRRIAVAPKHAWSMEDAAPGAQLWGTAAQIYALRGGTTSGFGDFAALADLAGEAAAAGADAVAMSPVHALFGAEFRHYSPYSPSTRLALNPLYAALPGNKSVPDGDGLVDWPEASKRKTAALRRAFLKSRGDPRDMRDISAFARAGGERLLGHARFEVLDARFRKEGRKGWKTWPAEYRDANSPAVRQLTAENREVAFQIYLQWMAHTSLAAAQSRAKDAGMRIGLIADMAIGTDPSGSHAWTAPDEVLNGLSVGAPPDIFNRSGQAWGVTTFSPSGLLRTGFSGFIATLRASMALAGGIRIDHAMGLMRLWVVPDGASAADGVYLHYPFKALLGLLALESQRHKAIVIAEDLGTVPDGFRKALADAKLHGMRVLWFERTAKGAFLAPPRWDPTATALSTTHDLPTIAGWWRGHDLVWREKTSRTFDMKAEKAQRARDRTQLWTALTKARCAQGAEPPPAKTGPVIDGALAFLARTTCPLALVPLEDFEGETEQPNLPGTTVEHPNWRRRLKTQHPFATREGRARAKLLSGGRKP